MTSKGAVLVIGTGDATGGAIAKRFAKEALIACITRRSEEKPPSSCTDSSNRRQVMP
jgi:NAD(P)-dependent dehydrogenase (short-subunit alcohol dehydrogenase family)